MPEPILAKGQFVCLRAAGTSDDWCLGIVGVASPNITPQAVALLLDGVVRARGGYIGGALPLVVDYAAETVMGLDGSEYEVRLAGKDDEV